MITAELLKVYLHQREYAAEGSIYKNTQCDFAYNSNHMEGSVLTSDQTRMIFERNKITGNGVPLDDIAEAQNHFIAFDFILDTIDEPLSDEYICKLHAILKTNTRQADNPMFAVGEYKKFENTIGDIKTTHPDKVAVEMQKLMSSYESQEARSFDDIVDFHYHFESIHPFSDGNGRVGRLVMFKECMRHNVTPFIILDEKRDFYIRGLRSYLQDKGWLLDTCRDAQDVFEEKYIPLAESYLEAMK